MKIVSWNCNMGFKDKFCDVQEFKADIYVIQECEDPARCESEEYKKFANNYIWIGKNKDMGLGIFANDDITMERIEDKNEDYEFRYFLPVCINDTFNLLAVWAMKEYVEMIHDYYDANKDIFDKNLVMCGDLNSSIYFDEKGEHKGKNFGMLIHKLEKNNLLPMYHYLNKKEKHGKESENTHFHKKKLNRGFHIDHVFSAPYITKELKIIDNVKWIKNSDHLPIVFEIDESKFD